MADTARTRIRAAQDAVSAALEYAEEQRWPYADSPEPLIDTYRGLDAAAFALEQAYALAEPRGGVAGPGHRSVGLGDGGRSG